MSNETTGAMKESTTPAVPKAPTTPTTSQAEKPKAEKPKAEKPKAEKPKAEKPKAEKPTTSGYIVAPGKSMCCTGRGVLESPAVVTMKDLGTQEDFDLLIKQGVIVKA